MGIKATAKIDNITAPTVQGGLIQIMAGQYTPIKITRLRIASNNQVLPTSQQLQFALSIMKAPWAGGYPIAGKQIPQFLEAWNIAAQWDGGWLLPAAGNVVTTDEVVRYKFACHAYQGLDVPFPDEPIIECNGGAILWMPVGVSGTVNLDGGIDFEVMGWGNQPNPV